MISLLKGTVRKGAQNKLTVIAGGVGYLVSVPIDVWQDTEEGQEIELQIAVYIREDRFDLFGFRNSAIKTLFEKAIDMPGIGPKTALEICSVPRRLLLIAVEHQDCKFLSSIKGIGKKTAEKLIVDLQSLAEKHPEIFAEDIFDSSSLNAGYDQDAIDALTALGYSSAAAIKALKETPAECTTSEQRVAAALRSL